MNAVDKDGHTALDAVNTAIEGKIPSVMTQKHISSTSLIESIFFALVSMHNINDFTISKDMKN